MTRLRSRNRVTRSRERTFMIPFVPHHAWRTRLATVPRSAHALTRARARAQAHASAYTRRRMYVHIDGYNTGSSEYVAACILGVFRNSGHAGSIAIISRNPSLETKSRSFNVPREEQMDVYIFLIGPGRAKNLQRDSGTPWVNGGQPIRVRCASISSEVRLV